jgi:hypothetical protein
VDPRLCERQQAWRIVQGALPTDEEQPGVNRERERERGSGFPSGREAWLSQDVLCTRNLPQPEDGRARLIDSIKWDTRGMSALFNLASQLTCMEALHRGVQVSSLRPELAAIARTLQATALETDLLYLCDSEAALNKVSRWIGSGPRRTLAGDSNVDIMTSIIDCIRERLTQSVMLALGSTKKKTPHSKVAKVCAHAQGVTEAASARVV